MTGLAVIEFVWESKVPLNYVSFVLDHTCLAVARQHFHLPFDKQSALEEHIFVCSVA